MVSLYYRYSAMNAGKSTSLIQVHYNYQEKGMRTIVAKPKVDTKSKKVLSRIGIDLEVDWEIEENTSILDKYLEDRKINRQRLECILVDEAQFLTIKQVNELFEIVVKHKVPVIAYGIRTDFRTKGFPGSKRLLEIAHCLEELKTICECGKKAVFNGRKLNDEFTTEGESVLIDENDSKFDYISLCGECYMENVGNLPFE